MEPLQWFPLPTRHLRPRKWAGVWGGGAPPFQGHLASRLGVHSVHGAVPSPLRRHCLGSCWPSWPWGGGTRPAVCMASLPPLGCFCARGVHPYGPCLRLAPRPVSGRFRLHRAPRRFSSARLVGVHQLCGSHGCSDRFGPGFLFSATFALFCSALLGPLSLCSALLCSALLCSALGPCALLCLLYSGLLGPWSLCSALLCSGSPLLCSALL